MSEVPLYWTLHMQGRSETCGLDGDELPLDGRGLGSPLSHTLSLSLSLTHAHSLSLSPCLSVSLSLARSLSETSRLDGDELALDRRGLGRPLEDECQHRLRLLFFRSADA